MHDHLDAAHNNISDISIAASDNHCFHIHIILLHVIYLYLMKL